MSAPIYEISKDQSRPTYQMHDAHCVLPDQGTGSRVGEQLVTASRIAAAP